MMAHVSNPKVPVITHRDIRAINRGYERFYANFQVFGDIDKRTDVPRTKPGERQFNYGSKEKAQDVEDI